MSKTPTLGGALALDQSGVRHALARVAARFTPSVDSYIATATVSAPRVVVTADAAMGVRQANTAIAGDGARVVGISKTSASAGGPVMVQSAGLLVDNSLALDVSKRVFCDTDGRLTQTIPATGWIRCVGTAVTPTTVLVDLNSPIFRP